MDCNVIARELTRVARLLAGGWGVGEGWSSYSGEAYGEAGDQAVIDALRAAGFSEREAKVIFGSKYLRWFYDRHQPEIDAVAAKAVGKLFARYLRDEEVGIRKMLSEAVMASASSAKLIQGRMQMNRKMLARELVKVAKMLVSIEFDSQDAMDKYLKEHPDADKSNHSVKKEESKAEGKKELVADHEDYSKRPASATRKIKMEIANKLGGHIGQHDREVGFNLGGGYKDSQVKALCKKVKTILKKHGIKPPESDWDVLGMKDGEGNNLIGVAASGYKTRYND